MIFIPCTVIYNLDSTQMKIFYVDMFATLLHGALVVLRRPLRVEDVWAGLQPLPEFQCKYSTSVFSLSLTKYKIFLH